MHVKNEISVEPVKPILRWAGSKKAVLSELEMYVPKEFNRYIELFSGSACLFFKLNPQKAILADNNFDLINFYQVFSKSPDKVYKIFASKPRTSKEYYKTRLKIQSENNPIKRAADFLYLNRNCFNGIYRTNSKGHFNVPFSNNRIAAYPSRHEFQITAEILARAEVACGDFEKICRRRLSKNDFVYLDPPYYVPNERVFKEYSGQPFSEIDFERLSKLLNFIDSKGAKFMLSYPDCSLSRNLASKWFSSRIQVNRIIGGTQDSRKGKYERIIRNYE